VGLKVLLMAYGAVWRFCFFGISDIVTDANCLKDVRRKRALVVEFPEESRLCRERQKTISKEFLRTAKKLGSC
jgi:hypothetical protein